MEGHLGSDNSQKIMILKNRFSLVPEFDTLEFLPWKMLIRKVYSS